MPKHICLHIVITLFSTAIAQKAFSQTGPLEKRSRILTVSYGAQACTCPQWIIAKDGTIPKVPEHIYLVPADSKLIKADAIWDGEHLPLKLKVKGRYYLKQGYPDTYTLKHGLPEAGRIFLYDSIEIQSAYFKNKQH